MALRRDVRLPFHCIRNCLKRTSCQLNQKCGFTSSAIVCGDQDDKYQKMFPVIKSPMLPANALKGKVAFITGGGTGLGRGMTEMISDLGAKVIITSRKLEVLENAANEIQAKTGNKVIPFASDVRDPKQVDEAVEKCVDSFGLPDIVINNAAGNFISPTERLSNNAFKTVLDIVLYGTANVTLNIGKRLIKANKGASFLSITAMYTENGSSFVVPSTTAKAGVEMITKSLAMEWSRYGMRFNCIAPGPFYTKGAFSRLDPTNSYLETGLKRMPISRLGEIEEIANLATYLVSDYSSWMTGEVVRFDGGMTGDMAPDLKDVTSEQWDQQESMIKGVKGS